MGILPEINRAWISVDNRLYLWDYNNPSVYALYNGLSDVIVSVALAIPKEGIFTDVVKYVLVVATTVEIALLAITCKGDLNDIKLQNTQYTISTDNSTVFKIVSTVKGRIFLAGNDRNLYELVYDNDNDTWGSYLGLDAPYKCRKVSHSGWSMVNVFDPVFRALGAREDGLVDLAVDDYRNILYGVSASGILRVFSLGSDGMSSASVISGFDIVSQVQDYYSSRPGSTRSAVSQDLKVASLHVVPPTEASNIHLVATMSSGVRVYISLSTSYGKSVIGSKDVPHALQVVNIRSPPSARQLAELAGSGDTTAAAGGKAGGDASIGIVHAAFYGHGADVFALSSGGKPNDLVVGIAEDLSVRRTPSTVTASPLTEGVCVVKSPIAMGKIYDIKEDASASRNAGVSSLRTLFSCATSQGDSSSSKNNVRGAVVASSPSWDISGKSGIAIPVGPPSVLPAVGWAIKDKKCGFTHSDFDSGVVAPLGEMTMQHGPAGAYPQRRILCLSNTGMHVLSKQRPADYLYGMLSRSATTNHSAGVPIDYLADVEAFFYFYGLPQSCAMCFGLACGSPFDAGGDPAALNASTVSSAVGLSTLQRRAVSSVVRYSNAPFCAGAVAANVGRGPGAAAMQQIGGNAVDPRVVPGESGVTFSACHDGLYLISCRLLRLIWNKTLVVNKTVSGVKDPVPVFVLSRDDLSALIRPLSQLVRVLKEYFGPAIAAAEAAAIASVEVNSLKLDKAGAGALLSRQMRQLGKASLEDPKAASTAVVSAKDKAESLDMLARKEEDASIMHLYRILCRSVQALQLLEILVLIAADQKADCVPWKQLVGTSFFSLVSSASCQEKIKSVVQNVLSKVPAIQADPLVSLIDSNCFMYFSAGDRLSLEASRVLDSASDLSAGDPQREALTSKAISLLLEAAVYWQSNGSVNGNASKLSSFCARLAALGSSIAVDGIVDLTIKVAQNFQTATSEKDSSAKRVVSTLQGDR
jgi:hypothetical protein